MLQRDVAIHAIITGKVQNFGQPVIKDNVQEETDKTLGMKRVEVKCSRCGAQLAEPPGNEAS